MANTIEAAEMIEAEIEKLIEHKVSMELVQENLTRDGYPNRDLAQRIEEIDRLINQNRERAQYIGITAE